MSKRSYTPNLGTMGSSSHSSILPTTINDLSQDDLASFRSGRSSTSNGTNRSRVFGSRTDRFSPSRSNFKIPIFIKRFFKPPTLDFETAIWEIFYLIVSPKRVYKSLYYHKQTKNRWARDDPSFMILLVGFLTLSAIAWGVAYSPNIISILKLILYMVFIDFFIVGVFISTLGWFLANRFFRKRNTNNTIGAVTEGDLEWAYCFDVHCNSFLVIWVLLYMIQFILLPLLTMSNWFGLFLGNTLYFISISYYFIITFYGYNALPFLEHTQLILFPIGIFSVLYFISLFGFNVAKAMTSNYFS
ncbi:putative membrane protein [Wickerhamomyces ciferrii]|uniref:Membrane protein n=1 Tax=Wickerhamomyces ciferrii (strain ATCC 14091 / BCRC 22168 / CBS 111 / JCM 3599 / NBRC 0793 / NRRL Y-1031 F-60-10) TaxID=1206466 RepID=K0KWP6_WICCF|nr:uncharacterized protein BN7_5125 [Wickerhamomyces ciferrii]CCH45543.1 putative membrane protein [Wickerhamomyces ciferrii]